MGFFSLRFLGSCVWVYDPALLKVTLGVLRRDFNACQRVYKCCLVKAAAFLPRGREELGAGGAGEAGPRARASDSAGRKTGYLLEGHPQGAHVHVGRHPAGVQVAGGAQDDPCREDKSCERRPAPPRPAPRRPRPPRAPHPPLCIWFSCLRHLALRFWNQTWGGSRDMRSPLSPAGPRESQGCCPPPSPQSWTARSGLRVPRAQPQEDPGQEPPLPALVPSHRTAAPRNWLARAEDCHAHF